MNGKPEEKQSQQKEALCGSCDRNKGYFPGVMSLWQTCKYFQRVWKWMAGGVKVEFIYGGELFCESMDEYKQKIKNIFLSFPVYKYATV